MLSDLQSKSDCEFAVSIVSHGQGAMIKLLLQDLENIKKTASIEIILTVNIPEQDEAFGSGLRCVDRIIRNTEPKGFGANHNAAFETTERELFVVVNPDIRMRSFEFRNMAIPFYDPSVSACAPIVVSSSGRRENSFRRFPTFGSLAMKGLGRSQEYDYELSEGVFRVEWVAGMFVVYRSSSFREIGGFDTRYFMYYEDADICRRLDSKGCKTVVQSSSKVIHDAQMDSRRKLRYLLWHLQSALRFLISY